VQARSIIRHLQHRECSSSRNIRFLSVSHEETGGGEGGREEEKTEEENEERRGRRRRKMRKR
jgi:hypothetical protein